MIYRDSKFWTRFSLVAAAATLALSLTPAVFAQATGTTGTTGGTTPPTTAPNYRQDSHKTLDQFNSFLGDHPDIRQQVRQDPSLLNNPQYLAKHPELNHFLSSHPSLGERIKDNPSSFLRNDSKAISTMQEQHADQVQSFDSFAKQNPGVGKAVMSNPSLASNPQYLAQHPQLASYLQQHPGVANDLKTHPEAFTNHAQRYNRRQNAAAHRQKGPHTTPPVRRGRP